MADVIPCPICGAEYAASKIERHAASCDGATSSQPTFTCGLCRKTGVPLDLCFRLDECGHPFCRICVTEYAAAEVFVSVTIKCPTCAAPLSIRDTELLLPKRRAPDAPPTRGAAKSHNASRNPTRRLMEEFRCLKESGASSQHGFDVELVDDNLFEWRAFFFAFDAKEAALAADLEKVSGKRITLCIKFPDDYPLRPPSVRVLRPRLQHLTGHVTIGGSVCFEMLTSQGWQPQFTVEALLVSIRTNLVVGGARVDFRNKTDYTEAEAKDAFDRMLRVHGWRN